MGLRKEVMMIAAEKKMIEKDAPSGGDVIDDVLFLLDEETGSEGSDEAINALGALGKQDVQTEKKEIKIRIQGTKEIRMAETLESFKVLDGFQAVGVFTAKGEIVAEVNVTERRLPELGALANDVLLKAQETGESMGVGRGNMVHIEAPEAHIIVRSLNESANYEVAARGGADIHMVLLLDAVGNIAMGKMKLELMIKELALFFR